MFVTNYRVDKSKEGSPRSCSIIAAILGPIIYHQKITPYHPQVNGTVEAFSKIMDNALTKVCNVNINYWDLRILVVLWEDKTTCKKLIGHTPFRLLYGQEEIMPMEYLMPCLRILAFIDMIDSDMMEERMEQLLALEEDKFIAGFH